MIGLQNVCQWGNGRNSCTSSRRQILAWVNHNLNTSFMRLEDLCSGVQYCQMLHKLRPCAINLKKVIVNTRAQHEHVLNMKLLQRSLWEQGVEKQIPILRLVAGGYRETLEFAQWFKAFYDRNYVLLQDEIAQVKVHRMPALKKCLKFRLIQIAPENISKISGRKESQGCVQCQESADHTPHIQIGSTKLLMIITTYGGVRKPKHIFKIKTKTLEYWIRQGNMSASPKSKDKDHSAYDSISTELDIEQEIALIMENVRNKVEELRRINRICFSKSLESKELLSFR
ncbi:uncharacterized protein LOC108028944 [Drosophila biarmipes]|uniref:uncharacterized protein LOC108028944 n=1 Tax=Drosophila biarmipes TaxID=125945 RepID=UPI0007E5F2C3|nr:uncharacterized protein LOC108028944 [Drosophila biarmipes]